MEKDTPLVITISRQLGSGGAFVGRNWPKRWVFPMLIAR